MESAPLGPLHARRGVPGGRLSARRGAAPGSRMGDADDELEEAPARRATERNFAAVDEARAIAAERGASIAQVALAWLLAQPGVTAPIIGPRTLGQLEDLLPATALKLTDDEIERLGRHTRPADVYPEHFLREQNAIEVERQPIGRP
jgi:aryl-alcohol dehydrogenase-like predicted oxidoreductase